MEGDQFEINDPTATMRNELVQALEKLPESSNAEYKRNLEQFRKGAFMIPSETLNRVTELIEKIEGPDWEGSLGKLYLKIMEEGK